MVFYRSEIDLFIEKCNKDLKMKYLGQRTLAKRTVELYTLALRRFMNFVEEVGKDHDLISCLKMYLDYLAYNQAFQFAQIKNEIGVIKKFLLTHDRIPLDAEDLMSLRSHYSTQSINIVTKQEIANFMNGLGRGKVGRKIDNDVHVPGKLIELVYNDDDVPLVYKAIILTLYFTGARPIDIVNMRIKHIKLDQRDIIIPNIKCPTRPYFVPIYHDLYYEFMCYYLEMREMMATSSDHLFPNLKIFNKGDYQSKAVPRIVRKVLSKYKDQFPEVERITAQSFRRTMATNIDRNVNLHTASLLLGHSSIKTTEQYLNRTEAVNLQGLQKLSKLNIGMDL